VIKIHFAEAEEQPEEQTVEKEDTVMHEIIHYQALDHHPIVEI